MSEEIIESTEVEEKEEEVIENDKGGEDKEEEIEKKEDQDQDDEEFDESKIEPETRANKKQEIIEEDEEIDPEDQKRISRIVNKEVGSKVIELENKLEVKSFISSKPEYSKYEGAILKYMSHEAYSNVPVQNIAAIVASKDMMKIGAAKEREAALKVAKTKNLGTEQRKLDEVKKDWHNASKEDYAAQRAKVFGH